MQQQQAKSVSRINLSRLVGCRSRKEAIASFTRTARPGLNKRFAEEKGTKNQGLGFLDEGQKRGEGDGTQFTG